jgi:glucan 1,3-beta-glucosidase
VHPSSLLIRLLLTKGRAAAMWDSHFRVGGAKGSDLQISDCPAAATSINTDCMAASLLMHITSSASGYFENVWAWVADHDLDDPRNAATTEGSDGIPVNVFTQISIYVGRGILIESQGPTWLYGTASEHCQMYQYQLVGASNVYLGHMQTETPYYQPSPNALQPYKASASAFPSDPIFTDCSSDLCRGAWALRVLNSSDVFIYSAGFYSFFQNNELGCVGENKCQFALIDTNFADALYVYNIFTKGSIQVVSPQGGLPPILANSTTLNGYTSEIAAWLELSVGGDKIGGSGNESGLVIIDPSLWRQSTASVACFDPCTYVLPPLTLEADTTFVYPTLTTEIVLGTMFPTSFTYLGNVTTTTLWKGITTTMTVTIPAITTSVLPFWEITATEDTAVFEPMASVVQTAFNITYPSAVISGVTNFTIPSRVTSFWPPPWPGSTAPTNSASTTGGPSSVSSPKTVTTSARTSGAGSTSISTRTQKTIPGTNTAKTTSAGTHRHVVPPVYHTRGPPRPTCVSGGCSPSCKEGIVGIVDSIFRVCSQCWTGCGGINGRLGQLDTRSLLCISSS